MSGRAIWNGKGEAEGKVWWTMDDGRIVGQPYVLSRARAVLRNWSRVGLQAFTADDFGRVLSETVYDADWCRVHHGETVASVCRAVVSHMLETLHA